MIVGSITTEASLLDSYLSKDDGLDTLAQDG